jgi:hypothetical protein
MHASVGYLVIDTTDPQRLAPLRCDDPPGIGADYQPVQLRHLPVVELRLEAARLCHWKGGSRPQHIPLSVCVQPVGSAG